MRFAFVEVEIMSAGNARYDCRAINNIGASGEKRSSRKHAQLRRNNNFIK